MDYNKIIEAFLLNPSETLNTELKEWINITTDEGKEKLIKSSIALFNNNGGYIAIGFKKDGSICKKNLCTLDQIKIQFNFDDIQAIISRYSSAHIETKISFYEIDKAYYPFIFIASGVKSPAFIKADLHIGKSKEKLLQQGKMYIRTLSSNGTVSSSEPRSQKDWDRLLNICLENKETDIAKFFQNNLTEGQLQKLKEFFSHPQKENDSTQKNNDHDVKNCLTYGYAEYQSIAKTKKLPAHGSFQIAFTIKNKIEKIAISETLLQIIKSSNPRPSGWPLWVVLQNGSDDKKPQHYLNRWQAFIEASNTLDFWMITEQKCFYHYRALKDDFNGSTTTQANAAKLKEIDFVWQVENICDAIASGLAFAQALNEDENTTLSFVFKWSGLKNRHLTTWAHANRYIDCESRANIDDFTYEVNVPINATRENIVNYTYEIASNLFLVFGGYDRIPRDTIAQIVISYLKWR